MLTIKPNEHFVEVAGVIETAQEVELVRNVMGAHDDTFVTHIVRDGEDPTKVFCNLFLSDRVDNLKGRYVLWDTLGSLSA